MDSEQNVPEAVSPQGPPAPQGSGVFAGQPQGQGMGQSKSSRRRRRKRKNKGGGEASAGLAEGSVNLEAAGSAAGSGDSAVSNGSAGNGYSPAAPPSQNGAQFREGGPTKRWKKKFRDRNRPFENGNGAPAQNGSGGGGGGHQFRAPGTHEFGNRADNWSKRKGGKGQRDRGPRGFVGPMDHSYRAVNGNFAESSPSTIEPNGNFSGRSRSFHSGNDSQPIDYSQGRAIPIAADAATRIYFFVDDLFFLAKIQETARKLGVKVAFIKNDKESIEKLTSSEENERPGLIVFDLNNAGAKPLTLIPKLRTKLKRTVSIIGFLGQVQGDLKAKAVEAGCDTVMPRSAFSQNLPNLLRRYGLEEEGDEGNFNR